jgi:SAM-dependent methyltransferase
MDKVFDTIASISEISDNIKYYWGYQYRLGRDFLVPELSNKGVFKTGFKVAEIGSAEGGALMAFAAAGAGEAFAADIADYRLESGATIARLVSLDVDYAHHDIVNDSTPPNLLGKFDLILLRDVIEHIAEPAAALTHLYEMLRPGGALYVSFPPYNSPFGGHQHTLKNAASKIPFIHLLCEPLFERLIRSGRAPDIAEVKRLRTIRLCPARFRSLAADAGFEIFSESYYLLRPVFRIKHGLPVARFPMANIFKGLRSISLEASYVLKKR